MGLTNATGPFSREPTGRFNVPIEPATGAVLFWDAVPQRIRVMFAGETVVDTLRAKLLHETGHLPVYYFPQADVRDGVLVRSEKRTHCPLKGDASYWSLRVGSRIVPDAVWAYEEPIESASFLREHVALYWHAADEWFVEDAQAFGHPRDPYHRIDVYPTTREVCVLLEGVLVARSLRAKMLVETGHPPRWYLPLDDVDVDRLVPSETKTRCAYKGSASYWHVSVDERLHEDVFWWYPEPQHDAEPVRGLVSFFAERADLELDGEPAERPSTQWSR
jgi:uncharacterized protein (DUF427 family)